MITTELVNDHGAVITRFNSNNAEEILRYAGHNLGWFSNDNKDGLTSFWGQVRDRTFQITVEGRDWIISWSNLDLPRYRFEDLLIEAIDGEMDEIEAGDITIKWEKVERYL